MKVRTIDISVKEWVDKVNGNSYFGGIVTINYGMKDERVLSVPFQYGYRNHSITQSFKILEESGIIPLNTNIEEYIYDNNIITRYTKYENCKQRDVKNYTKV